VIAAISAGAVWYWWTYLTTTIPDGEIEVREKPDRHGHLHWRVENMQAEAKTGFEMRALPKKSAADCGRQTLRR
jgi:hypothetical protein